MTTQELISIFQHFAGETLYLGIISATKGDSSIYFRNIGVPIVLIIMTIIALFCVFIIYLYFKGEYNYKVIDGPEAGAIKDREEIESIKNVDLSKYKKVTMAKDSFKAFIFLIGFTYFSYAFIFIPHNEEHHRIKFQDNKMVLYNNIVSLHSILHNDTVYYKDITKITVQPKITHVRKRGDIKTCVFSIQTTSGFTTSFLLLDTDMKIFKMKSCFHQN